MSNSEQPETYDLKTTGIVDKLSERLEYKVDLDDQTLSDYFGNWQTPDKQKIQLLTTGAIYRIKTVAPDHVVLRSKTRGSQIKDYIDCKYDKRSSRIVMDFKVSDRSAYFSVLVWPSVVALFLAVLSLLMGSTSAEGFYEVLIFFIIAVLVSFLALVILVKTAKRNMREAMLKSKGLRPVDNGV